MNTGVIKKRKNRFISIMMAFLLIMTQSEAVLAMETSIAEDIGEELVLSAEADQESLDQAIVESLNEKYIDQVSTDMATELTITVSTHIA